MEILLKILDLIIPPPKADERKPPCAHLYWGLPDKIRIGKEGRMKPICDLELKPKPTCGGFYSGEPKCVAYKSIN